MSEFVTFYSFKGGVGRTLALANVATLLANDKQEPCRVLAWDFDLAAPGLQQVLRCKWQGDRLGFVDYVLSYLKSAEMPPIDKYIHATAIPGVDILPAGYLDHSYAAKLERIRWDEVYSLYRGFVFIDALKDRLRHILPKYDYILVDSLTGYSDIGGICVQQLPDIVVLLFRLNDQNLGGISKVYSAINNTSIEEGKRRIEVIPVISPAWPFVTQGSGTWYARTKKTFSADKLFEISFDPSLTLGERVIANKISTATARSKILQDYRRLTRHIRFLNPKDLRTMFERIPSLLSEQRFSEAVDNLTELIAAHPAKQDYWHELVRTLALTPRVTRDKLNEKAAQIFDKYVKQRIPYASIARAQLLEREGGSWSEIFRNLSDAVRVDPGMAQAYFARGSSCMQHGAFDQAISDFSKFLEQKSTSPSSEVANVYATRAACSMQLHRWEAALSDLDAALSITPSESSWLVQKARTLLALDTPQQALETIRKASLESNEFYRVVESHILASLGREDEAQAILDQLDSKNDIDTAANVAEAYLLLEPRSALSKLKKLEQAKGHLKSVVFALEAVGFELLDEKEKSNEAMGRFNEITSDATGVQWEFLEMRAFLKWGVRRSKISSRKASNLLEMIDHLEDKLVPKDRSTVAV